MPLFVVLRHGVDAGRRTVRSHHGGDPHRAVAQARAQRHLRRPEIPRTLSGKKLEVPIKRVMLGEPVERVVNLDAVANPASLEWYVRFAQTRLQEQ